MNREIKFRVWDSIDKIWKFGKISQSYEGNIYVNSLKECKRGDFIIQQFTSILDKNKIEIFEGDIVNVNDKNHEIIWRGSGFYCTGSEYALDTIWFMGGAPEVVGNIFENPELIKK